MKHYLISFLSLLILPLFATIEYDIIPLEPADYKPGTYSVNTQVSDLSESGYIVGRIENYPNEPLTKSFIYHQDSGFKLISGPLANGDITAEKVNDEGHVVGTFNTFEWEGYGCRCDYAPYFYNSKSDHFFEIPKNFNILGLNNSGTILMNNWDSQESYTLDIHTKRLNRAPYMNAIAINNAGHLIGYDWFFSQDTGQMERGSLDPLNRWNVTPEVLNDLGTVAGYGRDLQDDEKGFLWSLENGLQEIETLGGNRIHITALNILSEVVGSSTTDEKQLHAFLFDGMNGTLDIQSSEWKKSQANSINNHSQVIGCAESLTKSKGKRAFIWDRFNGMRDLNDLIPPNSGWKKLRTARKINDNGYIVGQGTYKGEERAFLLIPKI